jgi:hypothetical protein
MAIGADEAGVLQLASACWVEWRWALRQRARMVTPIRVYANSRYMTAGATHIGRPSASANSNPEAILGRLSSSEGSAECDGFYGVLRTMSPFFSSRAVPPRLKPSETPPWLWKRQAGFLLKGLHLREASLTAQRQVKSLLPSVSADQPDLRYVRHGFAHTGLVLQFQPRPPVP